MFKFVTTIENFWTQDLENHSYARKTELVAKNFDHLKKEYYDKNYILQSFDQELPCANKFKQLLSVEQGSVSWTCLLPNSILPTHTDRFYTLRQNYNFKIENCVRYLVFLEDWLMGQYVGFEDNNITRWKTGDVYKFDHTEIHFAVNASNEPFHTCQVSTGI